MVINVMGIPSLTL